MMVAGGGSLDAADTAERMPCPDFVSPEATDDEGTRVTAVDSGRARLPAVPTVPFGRAPVKPRQGGAEGQQAQQARPGTHVVVAH